MNIVNIALYANKYFINQDLGFDALKCTLNHIRIFKNSKNPDLDKIKIGFAHNASRKSNFILEININFIKKYMHIKIFKKSQNNNIKKHIVLNFKLF